MLTDDPAGELSDDASVLALTCAEPPEPPACDDAPQCAELPQCQDDLMTCDANAHSLAQSLQACQVRVEALEGDADGDGIPNQLDACPGTTPPGVPVDATGCSQRQFCARHGGSGFRIALRCLAADWRNDEPVGFPGDCSPSVLAGTCSAR